MRKFFYRELVDIDLTFRILLYRILAAFKIFILIIYLDN